MQPLSAWAVSILSTSALTAAASTLPAAAWNRANDAVVAAFGMIGVVRSVMRNGANLFLSTKTTVVGSGADTLARFNAASPQKLGMNVQFLERARSNVNLTSSDVKSEPSCHLIPVLSLTVQVSPSALTSGRAVAMSGVGESLLSARYMPV